MGGRGASTMQECVRCGQIRPDSQSVCDCLAAEGRFERRPSAAWSTTALLTTIAAEVAMLGVNHSVSEEWFFGFGKFVLLLLTAFVGVVASGISGIVAHRRGEGSGGRIAVFGIVFLVGTLILLRR